MVRKFLGKHDEAIEDYSTAIRLEPTRATHYKNRALIWHYSKGNHDAALADYNESIRLDPTAAMTFLVRAELFRAKNDFDAALSDYNEAIRLDPTLVSAFDGRGFIWKSKGDLGAAIADYEEAIRLDENNSTAYSNLAWILATANDPKFRDAKRALLAATVACKLTSEKEVAPVRALAAAYAEAGDFPSAIREQTKALELISEKNKPAEQSRLKYYQAGKPYRDKTAKRSK
jgi:tetratricopeptide (TPR) repeat protein